MEETGGQRVYSKYTADLPGEVEESSWTSTGYNRTASRMESVQVINARGDQIRVQRFVCDEFPFCLWIVRKWVVRGWYFLLHTTHKFVLLKRNEVQSKYVRWKGYKFFAIFFIAQRGFEQLKRQTIHNILRCNNAFHSTKHWSSSPASTGSGGMNHALKLILQHTNFHHPTIANKRSSAPHLNPRLPLLLLQMPPGLQEFFLFRCFLKTTLD